jgi:hypothetical protein
MVSYPSSSLTLRDFFLKKKIIPGIDPFSTTFSD